MHEEFTYDDDDELKRSCGGLAIKKVSNSGTCNTAAAATTTTIITTRGY